MKSLTDTYKLYNGVEIPCLGYGTWQTPNGPTAINAVKAALEIGYRHVDTAAAYLNEESVGTALKESGIPRNEIFVTSKLWNADHGYDKTLAAFDKTLANLQTDYLDLYLIHWPIPMEKKDVWKDLLPDTWRAFEKLYNDKRVRAIGVSNFRPHHIQHIVANGTIKPMVDQIEFHPGFTQPEVVAFCKGEGIQVQAWSPLAQKRVFDLPLLNQLSEKYNKSLAQICLRWEIQNGVNPLPKSTNPDHIRSNAEIFDFALTDEEVKALNDLPISGETGYDPDNFVYPS